MNEFQHTPGPHVTPQPSIASAQIDKPGLLADYARRYGCRTLIETGLYNGVGSGMGLAGELRYFAVDWQQANVRAAQDAGYNAIAGDSPRVLRLLLTQYLIKVPVLFWLDAHALDEDEGSPQVCPVLDELDVILRWRPEESVVLIDDLWGMGYLRGWPTLEQLREKADSGPWIRTEDDGIMRLVPR